MLLNIWFIVSFQKGLSITYLSGIFILVSVSKNLKVESGALEGLKTGVLSGLTVGTFTATVEMPRPGALKIMRIKYKLKGKNFN